MSDLEDYSIEKLHNLATKMGIKIRKQKNVMINLLREELSQRFVKIKQLGHSGKEGTTFLVYDHETEKYYAMKTFRKTKSVKTIEKECEFQKMAKNISPKIIFLDLERKAIVMEQMEETLIDVINRQKGRLTTQQQNQILNLFYTLDELQIFHNDPNPLNIMLKDNKFYMIDFGFARNITPKDIKDYGKNPNKSLMCLGLLIWLKKLEYKCKYFNIFLDNISEQSKIDFGFLQEIPQKKERDVIPHKKERQEIPHKKERQEIPHKKERQEIPHKKERQEIPHKKERQENPRKIYVDDDSERRETRQRKPHSIRQKSNSRRSCRDRSKKFQQKYTTLLPKTDDRTQDYKSIIKKSSLKKNSGRYKRKSVKFAK